MAPNWPAGPEASCVHVEVAADDVSGIAMPAEARQSTAAASPARRRRRITRPVPLCGMALPLPGFVRIANLAGDSGRGQAVAIAVGRVLAEIGEHGVEGGTRLVLLVEQRSAVPGGEPSLRLCEYVGHQ